jgi:hypothetical protein
MSDLNLLVFGCAVSFIAAAGAYLFFLESFTAEDRSSRPDARRAEDEAAKLRNPA